jgi:hypothetical protein
MRYDEHAMLRLFRFLVATFGLTLLLSVTAAQAAGPAFRVAQFGHYNDGADQLFTADIQNISDHDAYLHGRLIVIDVYDTNQPTALAFGDRLLHVGETAHFEARWSGASIIGSIRTLLILSDDDGPSYVQASDFWIAPVGWRTALLGLAGCLALIIVILGGMRFMHRKPKPKINQQPPKKRVPPNTVAHTVDVGETVMSVAERYSVSWEDLAKVNRLKPPYELKPGSDLFVPRHPLQRPPAH